MIDKGHSLEGLCWSTGKSQVVNQLHTCHQSSFFRSPNARKAGMKSVMAIPLVHEENVFAVLLWYSTKNDIIKVCKISKLRMLIVV